MTVDELFRSKLSEDPLAENKKANSTLQQAMAHRDLRGGGGDLLLPYFTR